MKQKKRITWKYLAFSSILFLVSIYSSAFASDVVSSVFTSQTASGTGSSDSFISVDGDLSYINKWNNSSVVGNYFVWYYHDSLWWYFRTNWSSNENQNVRVVWSTDACPNSYGYKLWWYAYNEYFWFVDFDYDSSNFVYYCIWDKRLHGYSYSSDLWFQNFEDIEFEIEVIPSTVAEEPTGNELFVNDSTWVTNQPSSSTSSTSSSSSSTSSSTSTSSSSTSSSSSSSSWWSDWYFIGWDQIEFEAVEESLFYIIK